MTVFHKILKIKPSDAKNPTKEIDKYLTKNRGISYVILQNTPAIEVLVIEFICSDKGPDLPSNAEDIDNLIRDSGIQVIKEMDHHDNEPSNRANNLMQIAINQRDKETEETKEIERA